MKKNKDLLIGLFFKQFAAKTWDLNGLQDFIEQKLKGLILLCDKLQEEGVDTIKQLEELYIIDLKNNLLTINGIIFFLSIKNGEKILKVVKKYQAEKYLDRIIIKKENEKRLIEYFHERQIAQSNPKKQWALNCERHQQGELK